MSNFTLKRKFPITANPQGTSTDSLTKIGIGNDIYDVSGGNADYVEVTQAEYNALSSAEKNNGTLYFITDAEGGGGNGGIDGLTVTPTDNIQIWLACAGLHQSYTTLNEVLADSGVLSALMASTNAVDYLVRSTTWASAICADELAMNYIGENNYCADVLLVDSTWGAAISASTYWDKVLSGLVPNMTSNTTPSGEVFVSSQYVGYPVWQIFDGDDATLGTWVNAVNGYCGYKFPTAVCIKKVHVIAGSSDYTDTFKIQGSNDNSTYTDISGGQFTCVSGTSAYNLNLTNNTKYQYYRILQVTKNTGNSGIGCRTLQFYGRADLPPVDDHINAKVDKTDIAPVETGTTASRAYAIGQQFYLNSSLYKAKAAIAQGATFTVGTNCELADFVTEQIRHDNREALVIAISSGNHNLIDSIANYTFLYFEMINSQYICYQTAFMTPNLFRNLYRTSGSYLKLECWSGGSLQYIDVNWISDTQIRVAISTSASETFYLRIYGIK